MRRSSSKDHEKEPQMPHDQKLTFGSNRKKKKERKKSVSKFLKFLIPLLFQVSASLNTIRKSQDQNLFRKTKSIQPSTH